MVCAFYVGKSPKLIFFFGSTIAFISFVSSWAVPNPVGSSHGLLGACTAGAILKQVSREPTMPLQ